MQDYFTLFLPHKFHDFPLAESSRHKDYLRAFQASLEISESLPSMKAKALMQILQAQRVQSKDLLEDMGFGIDHIYIQDLDMRTLLDDETKDGWCAGIVSYWLMKKKVGHDLFPDQIFQDKELWGRDAVPIRLMRNQAKLARNDVYKLLNRGMLSASEKIMLDFIAGGRAQHRPPVAYCFFSDDPKDNLGHMQAFLSLLRGRPDMPGLFYIHVCYQDSSVGHIMGLDASGPVLFDPNIGIVAPLDKNLPTLCGRLFSGELFHALNPQTPSVAMRIHGIW